jgi:DNA-binding response OmpR family regulator
METPTILIVDDDRLVRFFLKGALRDAGFKVLEAGNGKDGLELSKSNPDMVLLDLRLPDADGLQLLQEMKAARADLPIVLMTSHPDEGVFLKGREAGALQCVAKPFKVEALLKWVADALALRPVRPPRPRAAHQKCPEPVLPAASSSEPLLALPAAAADAKPAKKFP